MLGQAPMPVFPVPETPGADGLGGSMSVELISVLVAVLAIGASLAVVILTSNRGLRKDIKDLRGEVGELRERMAKLEGLLEGLREAITGRAKAS